MIKVMLALLAAIAVALITLGTWRWTDNRARRAAWASLAARMFQLQPFGGYLSDFGDVGGFRLPRRVEAGNYFESADHFAFFKATVTAVRYPAAGGNGGDDLTKVDCGH